MVFTGAIRSHPLVFLFGLAAISLVGLLFVSPIPQPQSYHLFADRTTCLGIPNFWNVASNVPFILVGAWGLWRIRGDTSATIFFLGVFLTGFGSAYYHWKPDDAGLFWDRLPISVAFMAIFANVIGERINARVGTALLWPLVVLGVVSLLIWRATDDLRLYGWVQFFPCVMLILMFWLLLGKNTGNGYWAATAVLYVVAKLFEHFDVAVYAAGQILSGHTLKHLIAAGACYTVLRALETRRPVT